MPLPSKSLPLLAVLVMTVGLLGAALATAVAVRGISVGVERFDGEPPAPAAPKPFAGGPVLESVQGTRYKLDVVDANSGGRELGRCVTLDGRLQLCEADEHRYHEMLVQPACALLPPDRPINALIALGGDCLALREVLKHGTTLKHVIVMEDEEHLAPLAGRHLPTADDRRGASSAPPPDPTDPANAVDSGDDADPLSAPARVRWYDGNVTTSISRLAGRSADLRAFDLIVLDAKNRPGPSPFTRAACKDLKALLSLNGVLAVGVTSAKKDGATGIGESPMWLGNLASTFKYRLTLSFYSEAHDGDLRIELFASWDLAAKATSTTAAPAAAVVPPAAAPGATSPPPPAAAPPPPAGGDRLGFSERRVATRFFDPTNIASYMTVVPAIVRP